MSRLKFFMRKRVCRRILYLLHAWFLLGGVISNRLFPTMSLCLSCLFEGDLYSIYIL